ncbi:hypothetical protein [Sphingomonas bacterium]|nr:hypothetical protein [Sphingomonas bacterium]
MARVKMYAGRVANSTAWLIAGGATLAAAYAGSAIAAHLGTLIDWR